MVSAFQNQWVACPGVLPPARLGAQHVAPQPQTAGAGNDPAQPAVRFVAVKLNNGAAAVSKLAPTPAGLEVVLASGCHIAVGPGFDVATLGHLVRALEGL